MYYTPIVRHGFRQGAVRVCIYTTRRAYRNLMSDYLFWNLPDFDKSNIKRRLRLNLMYQGIRTGSLPHCHQQFPSRHRAWSSTNCVQRYTKSPELPNNSGYFLRLLLSFIVTHVYFLLLAKHLYTVKICLFNWRESFHLIFAIFGKSFFHRLLMTDTTCSLK